MTAKLKLYIFLLVLGLVVIGGGVWMIIQSPPEIEIPEGNPVIYEQVDHFMRGEFEYLYIYDDGSIIYIEEKGLRPSGGNPTRTWKTGKIGQQQLDNLLAYLENSQLEKLEDHYIYSGEQKSDMQFTITVNSDNLSKTVSALGYPVLDNGEAYPDMPVPLNEIYKRLKTISVVTEQVYQEAIRD